MPTLCPLSLDTSLDASDHVLAQPFDGALTMLDTRSEAYFSLDEVGARMWTAVAESNTLRDAHRQLAAEFDVDQDELAEDLVAFAAELVNAGLMVVTGGNTSDGATD